MSNEESTLGRPVEIPPDGETNGWLFGRPVRIAGSRPMMYLSAAISGTADHRERFAALGRLADEMGYVGMSPLDIPPWEHAGRPCPRGRNGGHDGLAEHTDACYMRGDMYHMLECDAILLDSTWRTSWGARAELAAATVCGLDIFAVVVRGTTREVVQL